MSQPIDAQTADARRTAASSREAGVRARVEALVRPEIRALTAYRVADGEGMVKLDAMENPYPLPAELKARLAAAISEVAVNRYPDASGRRLKQLLRTALALPAGVEVALGNGSDELIQLISSALARPGATMLCPDPTFVMYAMNATFAGMRYVAVPLRADFSLDADVFVAAIERERPALVFLAYPNNPTGNRFAPSEVERVLRAASGLVVVDEAYYAFSDHSFVDRVAEFPNLLVLRTVSKIGLAGIRLGYAVAAEPWIAELDKVRAPYNVSALTQAAAEVVLGEPELLAAQAAAIRRDRRWLAQALARLPGVQVFASEANFVLARVPAAGRVFDGLRQRRILVKNLHGAHPLLADCLRITVGTPEQNRELMAVMEELCG